MISWVTALVLWLALSFFVYTSGLTVVSTGWDSIESDYKPGGWIAAASNPRESFLF